MVLYIKPFERTKTKHVSNSEIELESTVGNPLIYVFVTRGIVNPCFLNLSRRQFEEAT